MAKKVSRTMLSCLIAALMLLACLTGCAQPATTTAPATQAAPAESETASQAPADGTVTIAAVCSNMADTFYTVAYNELNKRCEEKGYTVQNYDAQGESSKQVNMVSNAIAQGVTAIIFDPIDSTALGPVVMEAKKAGIIVITIVTDLDSAYEEYRDCYCGPNDIESGELAAAAMKECFPDGAKVVAIEAPAGSSCQILRQDGFEKGIAGSNIELLDKNACGTFSPAEAQTIAEDFLIRYGDELDGIFVHWDDAGVGVMEAMKGAGYNAGDIKMVTVDGSYGGFDLVRNGWSYACIFQSIPETVGIALDNLDTLLAGGTVESNCFNHFIVVTEQNIDEYDPGW